MDSHKFSTQVERLEVVETGRRRHWTDDEKLKIVLESMHAPRAISSTARRHGISRSLLLTWRRLFAAGSGGNAEQPKPAFVPAVGERGSIGECATNPRCHAGERPDGDRAGQ